MTCEFFSLLGACKYNYSCQKQHTLQPPSNFIILRNISPFTENQNLNSQLLLTTMREIYNFAQNFGKLTDFTIATNQNHLFGSVFLLFETIISAQKFMSEFPQKFAGKPVISSYLQQKPIKAILCRDSRCDGFLCQKVHEKYFSVKELEGGEKKKVK